VESRLALGCESASESDPPHVEALLPGVREPLHEAGLTPIAARALLRAIEAGAAPCFLADLRNDNGPFAPFFAQPARSLSAPRSSPT